MRQAYGARGATARPVLGRQQPRDSQPRCPHDSKCRTRPRNRVASRNSRQTQHWAGKVETRGERGIPRRTPVRAEPRERNVAIAIAHSDRVRRSKRSTSGSAAPSRSWRWVRTAWRRGRSKSAPGVNSCRCWSPSVSHRESWPVNRRCPGAPTPRSRTSRLPFRAAAGTS
jgi:hypothetical protein